MSTPKKVQAQAFPTFLTLPSHVVNGLASRLFVLTAMAVEDALIAILCCREHSPGFFHGFFI